MAEPKLKARRVKHVNFHLGVQFGAKVHSSLNADKHGKDGVEMWALPNGELSVKIYNREWFIPSGVQHSKELFPEE